jgi:hypothetical protein
MQAKMMRAKRLGEPVRGRSTTVRPIAAAKKVASTGALSSLPGVGPKLEGLLKGQGCANLDDLVRLHIEQNNGDAESTKAWLMVSCDVMEAETACSGAQSQPPAPLAHQLNVPASHYA